jgi:hypothetical protein
MAGKYATHGSAFEYNNIQQAEGGAWGRMLLGFAREVEHETAFK